MSKESFPEQLASMMEEQGQGQRPLCHHVLCPARTGESPTQEDPLRPSLTTSRQPHITQEGDPTPPGTPRRGRPLSDPPTAPVPPEPSPQPPETRVHTGLTEHYPRPPCHICHPFLSPSAFVTRSTLTTPKHGPSPRPLAPSTRDCGSFPSRVPFGAPRRPQTVGSRVHGKGKARGRSECT